MGWKGSGTTKNAGVFKLRWQAFMHVKLTKKLKLKKLFNLQETSTLLGYARDDLKRHNGYVVK